MPVLFISALFFFLLAGCCLPPEEPAFAGVWTRSYGAAAPQFDRYTLTGSSFQYDYYVGGIYNHGWRGELSYTSTVITMVQLEETTTEGGPWSTMTTPIIVTYTYSLSEPTLTMNGNVFTRQ